MLCTASARRPIERRGDSRVILIRRKHTMSVESMIAEIEQLNVLDLVQLTKQLEERWGVSAAPIATGQAAGPGVAQEAPAAAPVEERTEFDAILSVVGHNKINVMKVVR